MSIEPTEDRIAFLVNDGKHDAYWEGYRAAKEGVDYDNPYATRKPEKEESDPKAVYFLGGKRVRAEALVVDEDTGQFHCPNCHFGGDALCGHTFGCPEC